LANADPGSKDKNLTISVNATQQVKTNHHVKAFPCHISMSRNPLSNLQHPQKPVAMNLFLKALLQIQLILDNPAKRTLIAPVFKIKMTVNNWRKVRFIKLTSHKF
jgi:hypothetical protein